MNDDDCGRRAAEAVANALMLPARTARPQC